MGRGSYIQHRPTTFIFLLFWLILMYPFLWNVMSLAMHAAFARLWICLSFVLYYYFLTSPNFCVLLLSAISVYAVSITPYSWLPGLEEGHCRPPCRTCHLFLWRCKSTLTCRKRPLKGPTVRICTKSSHHSPYNLHISYVALALFDIYCVSAP